MVFLGLAMRNIDINAVNLHNVKGRVIGNIGEGEGSDETFVSIVEEKPAPTGIGRKELHPAVDEK